MISSYFVPLTALWAFVESGLGGLMHALHIPLTGIVLGGFSVLIIGLLASLSERPLQEILSATSIVIIIKAMVNPTTPPMAYMAVTYQAVSGAFLFSLFAQHRIICILYAVMAMLESAAQKLLIISLFFGKTIWEGIDALGDSAINFFFSAGRFLLEQNTATGLFRGLFSLGNSTGSVVIYTAKAATYSQRMVSALEVHRRSNAKAR